MGAVKRVPRGGKKHAFGSENEVLERARKKAGNEVLEDFPSAGKQREVGIARAWNSEG